MRPLCFILMPFGKKPAGDGRTVDFDSVYELLIRPAVEDAGLEPLRADEETAGGVIHKAMFERLILCEYAVADLTTANANVFYELGLRHAVRPHATQLIFAEGWGQLPFDVGLLRALPYRLGADGRPADATGDAATLSAKLSAARGAMTDSPVFQMVEGFPDIQRLKTDVFRDRIRFAADIKDKLAEARRNGPAAVHAVDARLGDIALADSGAVIDLFLSYRAVSDWAAMIALSERMAPPLAATVLVREQRALALNRAGRGEEAEAELLRLIAERGASSETCGILGRVYKDCWQAAHNRGEAALARGLLDKAIAAYLRGFEADWRDAYPGINAVTLMEIKDPPDPRQAALLPVVHYAVKRRVVCGAADYWDYASSLELAVLARDKTGAEVALGDALAHLREGWEATTTARNLQLIADSRSRRDEATEWLPAIIAALGDGKP
ncbi:MAG: TRAFs-binding domain-containing protein [Rhodocyclaceae bacterium]